jgi:hypothetical protein
MVYSKIGFVQIVICEKVCGFLIRTIHFSSRFVPSQADVAAFDALKGSCPDKANFPHAARWYKHIESFEAAGSLKLSILQIRYWQHCHINQIILFQLVYLIDLIPLINLDIGLINLKISPEVKYYLLTNKRASCISHIILFQLFYKPNSSL